MSEMTTKCGLQKLETLLYPVVTDRQTDRSPLATARGNDPHSEGS